MMPTGVIARALILSRCSRDSGGEDAYGRPLSLPPVGGSPQDAASQEAASRWSSSGEDRAAPPSIDLAIADPSSEGYRVLVFLPSPPMTLDHDKRTLRTATSPVRRFRPSAPATRWTADDVAAATKQPETNLSTPATSAVMKVPAQNVLPFGFRALSQLLSLPGMHVEGGIVLGMNPDTQYRVRKLDGSEVSLPLAALQLPHPLWADNGVGATGGAAHFSCDPIAEKLQLSVKTEETRGVLLPPIPVGTRVHARRRGLLCGLRDYELEPTSVGTRDAASGGSGSNRDAAFGERHAHNNNTDSMTRLTAAAWMDGPHRLCTHCHGTVVAAKYDVTYTIRFDDGGVETGVLHANVRPAAHHPAPHGPTSSRPERVGVRDRVVVTAEGMHRALVLRCLGGARYSVLFESGATAVLDESHVAFVAPRLPTDPALHCPPEAIALFREADPNLTGTAPWVAVKGVIQRAAATRQLVGNRAAALRGAYVELSVLRRRALHHVLGKAIVEDDGTPLAFGDFLFVLLRVFNRLGGYLDRPSVSPEIDDES